MEILKKIMKSELTHWLVFFVVIFLHKHINNQASIIIVILWLAYECYRLKKRITGEGIDVEISIDTEVTEEE